MRPSRTSVGKTSCSSEQGLSPIASSIDDLSQYTPLFIKPDFGSEGFSLKALMRGPSSSTNP